MTTPVRTAPQVISITPVAHQALQEIITERNLEGYALRIYASGGGCCGAQFGMALDNSKQEQDVSFDVDGLQVIVDTLSMEYLHDASIDFVNHPQHGPGFLVNQAHESNGEETCACGGSCACSN